MTNPYGDTADAYWRAGWRGILPLPHAAKKHPPVGYTGSTGTDPAYPDIATWADGHDGPRNICLRLPANILGIDIDAYGDKKGAATLADMETAHGPLPPTWRTTSRDDGTSGIRLYRIPEGLAWPSEAGPGIETVHRGHRYTVVWPSQHPEGGTYRWINPHGVVTLDTIPDPDTLPLLPETWIAALTGGQLANDHHRNTWAEDQAMLWIANLPHSGEAPCTRMTAAVHQAVADIATGSAHDATTAAAARALRLGAEGHHGTVTALTNIRAAFTNEATRATRTAAGKTRRTRPEADREWRGILTSGVNLISANPSDTTTCDCDGGLTDTILGAAQPPPAADDDTTAPSGGHPHFKDGAAFILDAPEAPPAVWGHDTEVLWAEGESCMIVGSPGVGKTTLTGQVLRARLGLGGAVLGYGVTPTSRKVLYLAMDRPAQIARSLRRHFTETDRHTLAARLVVWQGPPPADLAANTDALLNLAKLADADTIIIDSVKDAAIGLVEDTVGAGYNRARQNVLAAGIQLLELHHQTKRGPNGAAPKQLADVYGSAWITAGAGSVILLHGTAGDPVVQLIHLKQPAEDIGPLTLVHDHATGTTTVDTTDEPDLRAYLVSNARSGGLTAKGWAHVITGGTVAEMDDRAARSATERARRQLEAAVKNGTATLAKTTGGKAGKAESRYLPASQDESRPNHAPNHAEEETAGQRHIR